MPHADVHMRLFSRVILELLADSQPLPRLWYFPGTARSVLIPTSDAHTSDPADYAALIAAVEAAGGQVSFYMPRFIDPASNPFATWAANGHEFGFHPYFSEDGNTGNAPAAYAANAPWFAAVPPMASRPDPPAAITGTSGWAGSTPCR